MELHFQLTLMIGCPEHKCVALTACPKCGEAPRWNRPGLLDCHCSHQLSHCGLEPLSGSEAMLLELVRRKALGLPQSGTIPNGFPPEALAAMDLHRLLSIIRLLGRYRLIGFGHDGPSSDAAILKAAATVLKDWPKGLHDLMIDLGFSYRTRHTSRVRTMQESFLDALALIGCGEHQTMFIGEVLDQFYQTQREEAEKASDARSRRMEARQMLLAEDTGDPFELTTSTWRNRPRRSPYYFGAQ